MIKKFASKKNYSQTVVIRKVRRNYAFIISFACSFFSLILSNVINRVFPRLPLPLIQIIFGVGIGFLLKGEVFELETELFLAFIIAPLLFREGEESDITSILRNWKLILFLIFPVIFVSTLGIGYLAKAVLPASVPLSACLAIGAALGPTDLVAYSAISKRFSFPKWISYILQGEGLLNDASGLVAFQVAVTALTTGAFSLLDASWNLVISVLGGFLVGLITALFNRLFLTILDNMDAADVTGALLLELVLPISSYFVAEEIHASGIIAVVVAGISLASRFKKITVFDAKLDSVSHTIWGTITFMLNGMVFFLLGTELPTLATPVLSISTCDTLWMFLAIVLLTAIMFGIRFVMISAVFAQRAWRTKRSLKKIWKGATLLTFSGVKGTVSIATILLLPIANMTALEHSLLLFTVAGVTLLSFLIGILVLPKLATGPAHTTNHYMQIAILNDVVGELEKDLKQSTNQGSVYATIDNYNQRLEDLILEQESNDVKKELANIRVMIMEIESEGLEYAYKKGNISELEYNLYQRYIKGLERRINRGFVSSLSYAFAVFVRGIRRILHLALTFKFRIEQEENRRGPRLTEENRDHMTELYLTNTEQVLEALSNLEGVYHADLLSYLKRSRLREAEIIQSGAFVERVITHLNPDNVDEMLRGYYLERKVINEYEQAELISSRYAKQLRKEVNTLEDYSLKETSNTLTYDMINLARRGA